MQVFLKLFSYSFAIATLFAFSAEVPAIDFAKRLAQEQQWHKDLIAKDEDLLDLYESYIFDNSTLNGNGDSKLNTIFGRYSYEYGRLPDAVNSKKDVRMVEAIINEQAKLINEGLNLTKNHPEINLKIKCTADCLYRMVQQKFPSYSLDLTQEPPFREKNAAEKQSNTESLDYSKQMILKSRMVNKEYAGWTSVGSFAASSIYTYFAIKRSSHLCAVIAAGIFAWGGYNAWSYMRLKNLPYPSDQQVYKIWAINLNPKFE